MAVNVVLCYSHAPAVYVVWTYKKKSRTLDDSDAHA